MTVASTYGFGRTERSGHCTSLFTEVEPRFSNILGTLSGYNFTVLVAQKVHLTVVWVCYKTILFHALA